MDKVTHFHIPVDENMMPTEPGAINGALYLREEPEEAPSLVINVPSIDEYLKKIEKAGGKVVWQKEPVGDFGFYAQISDTEGNVLGLWEGHCSMMLFRKRIVYPSSILCLLRTKRHENSIAIRLM